MDQDEAQAPLAKYAGARPPAPAWFEAAMAQAPERRMIESGGSRIETLAWGERGEPGLLFLHGNGAHADWWSFIAPFFAAGHRVAAFSLPGMGGSDWRGAYSLGQAAQDAQAVAKVTGLFESDARPVFVGHSLGAMVSTLAAGHFGERLGGVVLVDPPFRSPERLKAWSERRAAQPPRAFLPRTYPTLEQALARFRFIPAQTSEHPYIVDHIARGSLKEVEGGWTWRFDPQLWTKMTFSDVYDDLKAPRCPVAFVHGERSIVATPEDLAYMHAAAPAGSPVLIVPEAQHHLMVDQPLAFVTGLRALLAAWPR